MEAPKSHHEDHLKNNNGLTKNIEQIAKLIIQLPKKIKNKAIKELLKDIELNQN